MQISAVPRNKGPEAISHCPERVGIVRAWATVRRWAQWSLTPRECTFQAARSARRSMLVRVTRSACFSQGFIGADRTSYEGFVRRVFGDRADEVLAHYHWPATADQFTAAYLIGAIETHDFARRTRTYAYEFAHRSGPGLTPIPG